MNPDQFILTEEHLALLGRAYVDWNDCETGAPAIDCKRPYGNSYVAGDVAEILGWPIADAEDGLTDEQQDKALALHGETLTALQIILTARDFRPGIYEKRDRYDARSWSWVGVVPDPTIGGVSHRMSRAPEDFAGRGSSGTPHP